LFDVLVLSDVRSRPYGPIREGSNAQRFPLCTILVKDERGHGMPCGFVITSSSSAETYKRVLNALRDHVGHDVQPKAILVDDADAEIQAIMACEWGLLGTIVALCVWHVKRAWLKALIRLVQLADASAQRELRRTLFAALEAIMDAEVREILCHALVRRCGSHLHQTEEDVSMLEGAFVFIASPRAPAFLAYYRREWGGKLEMWVKVYRGDVPNTNGVIEAYHGVIKSLFFTSMCVVLAVSHCLEFGLGCDADTCGAKGNFCAASASTGCCGRLRTASCRIICAVTLARAVVLTSKQWWGCAVRASLLPQLRARLCRSAWPPATPHPLPQQQMQS
jgi:hypothetical protein